MTDQQPGMDRAVLVWLVAALVAWVVLFLAGARGLGLLLITIPARRRDVPGASGRTAGRDASASLSPVAGRIGPAAPSPPRGWPGR